MVSRQAADEVPPYARLLQSAMAGDPEPVRPRRPGRGAVADRRAGAGQRDPLCLLRTGKLGAARGRSPARPRGTNGTIPEPPIKDHLYEHGRATHRHVVLVGAGFGGLAAARALRRAPVQITIIDRSNHHLFQPLLYQVATAALSPADIAAPIRRIFRHQANVTVMLADATAINVAAKRVVLLDGAVDYDILILATGATHAYFGHDDWAVHAPGLKSLKDALRIRQRVLMAFEVAERETDDAPTAAPG